jgi:hypothetical protein
MSIHPMASRLGRGAAVAIAAAGVMSLTALTVGQAAAEEGTGPVVTGPVTKNLTFSCEFPLVGQRQAQAVVKATFPDSVAVGQPIDVTDFGVDVTLDAGTTDALRLVGGASVEGSAVAAVDLDVNGTQLGVGLNGLQIPSTPVPPSGALTTTVTGPVPSLSVKAAGQVSFSVGNTFTGTITPKKADGTDTDLGTFSLPCTMDPGQDASLATVPVQ